MDMPHIPIFFIDPEDWQEWCLVNAEGAALGSYDAFLEEIEKFKQDVLDMGGRTVEYHVHPHLFREWCRRRNLPANRTLWTRYAAALQAECLGIPDVY